MLFSVPLFYAACVVPKGGRRERVCSFREMIDIEIPHVTDFDAPVALRWRDGDNHRRTGAVGGICERRWYEGKLWMPETFGYEDDVTVMDTKYFSLAVDARRHELAKRASETRVEDPMGVSLEEYAPRATLWDERFFEADLLKERAGNYLIIEDSVWMTAPEPAYLLESRSFGHPPVVKVLPVDELDGHRAKDTFRADRYDDMILHAHDKIGVDVAFDAPTRIDVLIPDCLSFDDETPAAIATLTQAVEHGKSTVTMLPAEKAMTWFKLRDDVAQAVEQPLVENIDTAIESLGDWISANSCSRMCQEFAVAVARWNARPVRLPTTGQEISR